jgi:hypothetical protein
MRTLLIVVQPVQLDIRVEVDDGKLVIGLLSLVGWEQYQAMGLVFVRRVQLERIPISSPALVSNVWMENMRNWDQIYAQSVQKVIVHQELELH